MSFKKVFTSKDCPIIIGNNDSEESGKLFPVGFSYMIGENSSAVVYTVIEDVTVDASSPMRKVKTSNGDTEILELMSIKKDLKQHDARILEDPSKEVKKSPKIKKKKKE